MTEISAWHITGDWFDNCSCAVACPCTFAQAPDNGFCESVRKGLYGDVALDDLSFVRVGRWEGDLWAGKARGAAGVFIDDVPVNVRRRYCRGFSAVMSEGFPRKSRRCFPREGRSAASSVRASLSRSRPTGRIGEPRSPAR
jgi:hypothetical protein